jgi:G protein beta subunit-like protein
MAINPDRKTLAVAGFQHIRMYDIPGGNNPNPVSTYEGVGKNVTAVGFQDDGRWMYSTGEDGTIRIWDLRSRNVQAQKLQPANCSINCVSLHPNQIELISGDQNGSIHVWDIRSDTKESIVVDHDISVQHLDIEAEGSSLACVDNKGNCYVYRLTANDKSRSSLKRRLKLSAHSKYALKCRFSPDSTLLVTSSADHTAKIWRTADLLPITSKEADEMTSSATTIVSSGLPPWPTYENLSPQMVLKNANQRWVWDVAFSLDSQFLITGSSDNVARLWNINTGDNVREYCGHQKAITAIAFADGCAS